MGTSKMKRDKQSASFVKKVRGEYIKKDLILGHSGLGKGGSDTCVLRDTTVKLTHLN